MWINKNIPKTILYTTFSFNEIETDLIKKMIKNLDSKKSGIFGNISANCLQVVSDISYILVWLEWWSSTQDKDWKFPSELKLADVIPAFKQEDSTLVENYNPISLYVNFLQVFWQNYLYAWSNYHLLSLWIQENTQTALSPLIEKWKQIIDDIVRLMALLFLS